MCWPARADLYGNRMSEAQRAHASVARTISGFEPVTVIANSHDLDIAAQMCGAGVEVITLPIDDSWFRDSGPIYVSDGNRREGTCWKFNSWGEKYLPYDNDAKIAAAWLRARRETIRSIDMVLEGGSINTNGSGTLLTTEQCLLNPNRNPHLSRAQITERLCTELGQERVVWLPHGLHLDDGTDGHVDNVAAFIDGETVILQGCDDSAEPDRGWIDATGAQRLRALRLRRGDAFVAIVGPGWSGTLPKGVQGIKTPTNMVWIIGRYQTNGPKDYRAVHAIQDKVTLTPLSAFGKSYVPQIGRAHV